LLRQKEKEREKERKSFVYKKESFGKKGNAVFYASVRTKRREGVFFAFGSKKRKFRPHQSTSHTSMEG
jgi:hypothetical protein